MKWRKDKGNLYKVFLIQDKVFINKVEQRIIGYLDLDTIKIETKGDIPSTRIGRNFVMQYTRLGMESGFENGQYIFKIQNIDHDIKVIYATIEIQHPEHIMKNNKQTLLDIVKNNNNLSQDFTKEIENAFPDKNIVKKDKNLININGREIEIPKEFYSNEFENKIKEMVEINE